MTLYAISDLHLSHNSDKPMDIFGQNWVDHHQKILKNWLNKVEVSDTVLVAGDISWAMSLEEAMEDLLWIHSLPGRKIFIRGNHDYWWSSINKLNSLFEDMDFIQNNYFTYEDYAICGTRGWSLPGSDNYTLHDDKIYKREIIRLKLSLNNAKDNGYNKFIVMMHYPPINDKDINNELTDIFKEYNVSNVIYGHLHNTTKENSFEGECEGIKYILTSCDYLNFDLLKLI